MIWDLQIKQNAILKKVHTDKLHTKKRTEGAMPRR